MLRRIELLVVALALIAVVVLAITDPGSDPRTADRRDVEVVRRAADRLDYITVADAWRQVRLGTGPGPGAITEGIDVRYLATHREGDAIIFTFRSRSGACIDLVVAPAGNTVEGRRC